jgi:imidazolonepropionase-like amidohydrolase
MAHHGIIVSPTLPTLLPDIRALDRIAAERPLKPAEQAQRDAFRQRLYWKVQHCVLLAQHGVLVANSTDAGWQSTSFDNFADGLELMVAAGMSTREAFRSATEIPAQALGHPDSLGHLRTGAWADAVVLHGNPLNDIQAVRTVAAVYVKGRKVV